ncbi:uncharacterized protein FOMMEDRAFT_150538 [Fomitiporia mediterranea MF3/22]|uniref:uncharacterized protein n=1 Tax=Fomitiporia mediterranea (strain MF3/22) TaxID=694068 RepID=UPI0004408009|nr:uncharacterized protein FOMMEDRAFT_150538 [Fomitiporia mediterranea MF3/22]EJD07940.1 hypothetical protein FOMMEDRAFT_150538 [Fomitiporia mediterranea MF3/22]
MRSNILSTTALLVASLFAAVHADMAVRIYQTLAYYPLQSLTIVLCSGMYCTRTTVTDAITSLIQTTARLCVEAVKANHDKGMRFRWGGDDTFVTCQAHSDHMLGFDTGAQAFKADFAKSHTDALVSIHYDKAPQKAYICLGDNCIGANASPTNQHYLWYFEAVPGA